MKKAKIIKQLINKSGMNVKTFAEKCGIPATTLYSLLKRGVSKASVDVIYNICQNLYITVEELEEMSQKSTSIDVPHTQSDETSTMYKRFESLLQENGLCAAQIAKATNIPPSTFTDWKNGRSIPKSDKIKRIADYLGVSKSWLEGDDSNLPSPISNGEYRQTFVENLNYYMYLNQKTQMDLMKDLNLGSSTISSWCTGAKLPRMDKIQLLADYFSISKSDLLEKHTEEHNINCNNDKIDMVLTLYHKLNDTEKNIFKKLI